MATQRTQRRFSTRSCARPLALLILAALLGAGLWFHTLVQAPHPVAHADSSTTTNGNGDPVDVGMWYVTYNNASMWQNNFGYGFPILYRPLLPSGSYGIPDSSSVAQVDFDLQQLANAKVDFVVLDETNGGLYGTSYYQGNKWIVDNGGLVAQEINTWNQSHAWKIKYAFAVGVYGQMCGGDAGGPCAENQAQSVWNYFVNNPSYGGASNYYQVNGKPLLVLYDWASDTVAEWNSYGGDKTYGANFTIRGASDDQYTGQYGWDTKNAPDQLVQLNGEVETISPGWNDHHGDSYCRCQGDHYTNAWNRVLGNPLPRIVMITSFNDYNEDTATWTTDTSGVDPSHEEPWTGHDGQLHPSMYWDMTTSYIQTLRNQSHTGVREGSDLARGKSATASSASSYCGCFAASSVSDGDLGSIWSSQQLSSSAANEWVYVDLGSQTSFDRVVLYPRFDGNGNALAFPAAYQVQGSNDATNWTTLASASNAPNPANSSGVAIGVGSQGYRYVRFLATTARTDDGGNYYVQLAELEVYNNALSTSESATASSASSYCGCFAASSVSDGDLGSIWSSQQLSSSAANEWVYVDLGAPTNFDRVALYPRFDNNGNALAFPSTYQVQGSNDATNWTTLASASNAANPTGGVAPAFGVGGQSYRYVRFLATTARTDDGGNYYVQLAELEVENS